MEYSVGSLADLITGSNTPNKPKVIQKEFKKIRNQNNIVTSKLQKSLKKDVKIENVRIKSPKNKIKNKKLRKLKNKNNENEEEIFQWTRKQKMQKVDPVNIKQKKRNKRKLDDSIHLDTIAESESTPFKKIKLSKNYQKAEQPIKNKTIVDPEVKNIKHKKKVSDDFLSLSVDTENEDSSEEEKLSQNDQNAERRIKNKEKKEERRTNIKDLERTLYVGNIPIQISKQKIKKHFKKYGRIETIRIRGIPVADPKMSKKVAAIKKEFNPKRKNVFCYIRFAKKEDALNAQVENGALFEEHHLRVHICSAKEKPDETKAIFVGNLSFEAEEDELWKLFETCGPISHVRIIRDSQTGMGKGFAYVNFKDSDAVQLALEMENVKLRDRELRIALSNLKVARKKKSSKNKKISQPRGPKDRKNKERNIDKNKSTENQGVNKTYTGFQGTKFNEKRKKHKVNKGLVQKKKMMKKIAPKN